MCSIEKERKEPLLEVKNLKKHFKINSKEILKAVDDVSFEIYKGETLGIVGESGCGKTTCGRTCVKLYDKTDGTVLFKGQDVHSFNKAEYRKFTKETQMIFQDPYSSLDSRLIVNDIIAEGMKVHGICNSKEERSEKIREILSQVGLNKEHASRYAYEFSGGQRQRIGIARALAVNPEFMVCDEPISALDVSVQAQIVNLLMRLQEERGLTYLFIAHDLSMVKHISDRIGVMYLGNLVELTTSSELYQSPAHPYTKALLSAIPVPDPDYQMERQRIVLQGDIPSPINPPVGCKFAQRCKYALPKCREATPKLKKISEGHFVACYLYD